MTTKLKIGVDRLSAEVSEHYAELAIDGWPVAVVVFHPSVETDPIVVVYDENGESITVGDKEIGYFQLNQHGHNFRPMEA